MFKNKISTIIISLNEEINIKHAIGSVKGWTDIFIVDSGSTDKTCQIANDMGATVVFHKFDNYAAQRNWALENEPFDNEWILFLDADEVIFPELRDEIMKTIQDTALNGFHLKRKLYFMGKWLKYSGQYPVLLLRLLRKGTGMYEREVNEHLNVHGKTGVLRHNFADINRKGIGEWIEKHNKYATYEARELLRADISKVDRSVAKLFGTQAQRKRWVREYIWNPLMPPLIRPFFLFFYRYVFKLGFLDGKRGFSYCFLKLGYSYLIDLKYIELKNTERMDNE